MKCRSKVLGNALRGLPKVRVRVELRIAERFIHAVPLLVQPFEGAVSLRQRTPGGVELIERALDIVNAAVLTKNGAVLFEHDGAAARCDDAAPDGGEVTYDFGFDRAECRFSP